MGQLGRFLRRMSDGYAHFCPACDEMHAFAVDRPFSNGARWNFDGNVNSPSFSPSMNIAWGKLADPKWNGEGGRCHYFLRSGKLQFLADCTHAFAGRTVDLPELPPGYQDA